MSWADPCWLTHGWLRNRHVSRRCSAQAPASCLHTECLPGGRKHPGAVPALENWECHKSLRAPDKGLQQKKLESTERTKLLPHPASAVEMAARTYLIACRSQAFVMTRLQLLGTYKSLGIFRGPSIAGLGNSSYQLLSICVIVSTAPGINITAHRNYKH